MPTLANDTVEAKTYFEDGETAGASGMLWIAENLECCNDDDVANNNDCTISGSFLESALEDADMRRKELAKAESQQFAVMTQQPSLLPEKLSQQQSRWSLSPTLSEGDMLALQLPLIIAQKSEWQGILHKKDPWSEKESLAPGMIHGDSNRSVSRTFDEDDLLARKIQPETPQLNSSSDHSMSRTFDDEDIDAQRHQQSSQLVEKPSENSQRSASLHAINSDLSMRKMRKRSPQRERKLGPNEQLYIQKYSALVANRIQAFRLNYPGQLLDYRNMTDEQKLLEQQRVMRLLKRLNIANNKENMHNKINEEEEEEEAYRAHRSKHAAKDVAVDGDDSPSTCANNQSGYTDNNQSMVLLSPTKDSPHASSLEAPNRHQTLFSPIATQEGANTPTALLSAAKPSQRDDDDDGYPDVDRSDSSTQSIEIPRADGRYESPESVRQHKKRLASTSGKRGADLARARLDDDSLNPMDEACSPSKFLVNSIGRLSLADEKIFTSSQSPIAHQMTHSPLQDRSPADYPAPDISFGEDDDCDSDRSTTKSRPVYDNDSLIETAMLPDKRVRWDFDGKLTKEAPTDVRLLDGKTFHLPKLPTERRQRAAPPTQSFPDPLGFYPDKIQRRLGHLYTWLLQRDQSFAHNESIGRGLVLSMKFQQITDLILKLHLDYPPSDDVRGLKKHGTLLGNTLIVARSKEELEIWGRSLREGSAFSVINHAALPLTQRKSLTSAEKCAQFDIVLTTYDALKSPDITVTLDNAGFAVNTKIGVNDGWYTSASQSLEQERSNKQFSVLHRINWRRLILVDVLGRKSYLAKSGTARVQVSRALNASARLAFFVVADDKETTGFQALVKSDRTAILSLASVLRLEDKGSDATLLRESIVDFQNESTYRAMKK